MSYLKGARSARTTPQREPIPGREHEMVENSAGGFVFELDLLARLRRFLILGAEGGTYYAGEQKLVKRNTQMVQQALDEHGVDAVRVIVDVSVTGAAIKQDPVIFALAIAATREKDTRIAALRALPTVCRTGYQLFMFLEFVTEMRGTGLTFRKGVAAWYEDKDPSELAFQMIKYRQRDGWTHKRALDLSHPTPPTPVHEGLYRWALGYKDLLVHERVEGFQWAQLSGSPADTAKLIRERPWLPREALRTEHTTDVGVWEAMLDTRMPMGALVRNLGRMTSYGVLKPMGKYTRVVCNQLRDEKALTRARVHPVAILSALMTYRSGKGHRMSWEPVQAVCDALDEAFYLAFGAVRPAGKRTLLAIDVSGSMTGHMIGGIEGLDARTGAAAMALVTAATEPEHMIVAFSSDRIVVDNYRKPNPEFYDPQTPQDWRLVPLDISARSRLADVSEVMKNTPAGGTDCAMPMKYAASRALDVDTFVIYTDAETWAGTPHPAQALQHYRKSTGIRDARLVVVGMAANPFTIADPSDMGMLDVVGFDTSAPDLISAFSRGELGTVS